MEYDIGEYLSYHRHKYIKEKGVINKKENEIKRLIPMIRDILVKNGAKKIIVFGSFAEKRLTKNSDLDIAEDGVPDHLFFKVYAALCDLGENVEIDLIDIAETKGFFRERMLKGEVIYNAKE